MGKTTMLLAYMAGCALGANAATLLTYDFKDTPTASKVDPGFVAADLAASDITEFGDPDGGGSSPELTNFSGWSLNIKRNSLNTSPMDFSNYLSFSVSAADSNQVIDPDNLEMNFNQFADGFSFAVYVDAGQGYKLAATLGGASNSNLVNSAQQLGLSSVVPADMLSFRIECAHTSPGSPSNTTLQFSNITLNGTVGAPSVSTPAAEGTLDLSRPAGSSNGLALSWPSVQGTTYAVQTTTDLTSGTSWQAAFSGIQGSGGICAVTGVADRVQGFYRVAKTASNTPAYAYCDIRDYGAVLNDGIDDSAAVQAAINAASAENWHGGTVYFPAGVTTLSKPVTMKQNVNLLGEGTPGEAGGSIIRAKASPDLTCLLYGRGSGVRYLSIEHLTFDGNGLTFPWAIDFEDAINLRIANVRVENIEGGGISQRRSNGDPTWVNFYENIDISINSHAGIGLIHGDSDSHLADITVTGADIGILETDGSANLYRNVVVSNCVDGFVIRDGANTRQCNSVFDSLFADNLENGMVISNTTPTHTAFIALQSNVFSGNQQRDLYLKDTSCIAVRNNEFRSSLPHDAIYMDPASVDSVTLVGNRFANTSQALAGTKSTTCENAYGLGAGGFHGREPLDIGPPPIIPPNVPCDINVKAAPYNAVGNNNTDDTAAIQAALDAAPAGAIIYFPPGRYKITAPLQIKSPVKLLGEYAGTYISAHASMDSMLRVDPAAGPLTNALISKLTFDCGRSSGYAVAAGVRMNDMVNCTLDRVDIRNLSGTGVLVPATGEYNTIRSSSISAQNTQIELDGSRNTIASVYGGGGAYNSTVGGALCGVRFSGSARFNTIYTSHFDHTRATNNVAALQFINPTASDQATVIRNSYFDLHYKGLFFDYASLHNANVVFEGNIFRAELEAEYDNRNASQIYLHGNVFMDDFSNAYILNEGGNQDYIETIGNVFKVQRAYTLPGAHSVDAANTVK